MDFLHQASYGFSIALQPANLFFCFLGCLAGTLIGVLPGIGPAATLSFLLPVTLAMSPVSAIILLSGIYYGALYGGSTTSILVNMPGEAASAVTCLDGYQMARSGRAGPALGIAAFGSFIAGTVSTLGLTFLSPVLADVAIKFGAFEYVSLMFLGLTILAYLARGSMIKALSMAVVGLIIGTVGTDLISGIPRFTFGIEELYDGVGLIPVLMGLFGIAEVLINMEESLKKDVYTTRFKGLFPDRQDWKDAIKPIGRGTVVGFLLGTLPGGGAVISSFVSYAVEKRVSKHPEKFGTGTIEGVAGPESANNAASTSSFIPLLTLGIPANVVMAMLLGALIIHGVKPGPLLMQDNPDIFWGTIYSMYLGNVMLLVLNLPLIGLWVKILRVPYLLLFPLILIFCIVGSYGSENKFMDVNVMIFFGLIGYLIRKTEYEAAPLVMAMVLGPIFEKSLRQALMVSSGSFVPFFTRPISGFLLGMGILLLITGALPRKLFLRKLPPNEV